MVVPTLIGVTDASGHYGIVTVSQIEKIVHDQDESHAVLFFTDGSTVPVRCEEANRLLRRTASLEPSMAGN